MHPDFNVIICTGGDTIIGVCNSYQLIMNVTSKFLDGRLFHFY